MALIRPGFGPGPQPGGAHPPTPPSWVTGGGHLPPDPGGPAYHVPPGMPTMPGNLSAGSGHPASFFTHTGTGLAPGAGAGYTLTTGTHPAVQHILGTGNATPTGVWPHPIPPVQPPPGWNGGPPPRNWFPPPGGGGDPYGPPVQPPAMSPWIQWFRQMYFGIPPASV